MAFVPGEGVRNRDRHLARLAESAAYFGFAFDRAAVTTRLTTAVEGAAPSRVRLELSRSGTVGVSTRRLPPPADGPVRLALDREPVDERQVWLAHKTTRRGVYTTAAARSPGADDVVLVNRHGQVTETTVANLAVLLDGRWWTPPVYAGCLPGVERGRLLDEGRLAERDLTVDDVREAEGLALVSSLRGWRPAVLKGTPVVLPGSAPR